MITTRTAFAARLREAMLENGHTPRRGTATGVDVQALKAAAGVSNEMARRYALGDALPDPDRIIKIADWLDVRVPWLRDGTPPKRGAEPHELSDEEQRLLAHFRQCGSSGRRFVLKAAESASLSMKSARSAKK